MNHLLKARSEKSLSPHRVVPQGPLGGSSALPKSFSMDSGEDIFLKKKVYRIYWNFLKIIPFTSSLKGKSPFKLLIFLNK